MVAPIIVQKSILSDNVLLGSHPKKPATPGNIPAHIGCPADIMDYSSVSTQNFACLPLVVVVLSEDLMPLQKQKSLLVIAVVKVSMLGTSRLKLIFKAYLGDMVLGTSNDHHLGSKFRGAPGQAVVSFLVLAWSIAHWERVDHGPMDQTCHIHGFIDPDLAIRSHNCL